ncbi:Hypothetical predicted protein [Mytilus galloprovincialis]|uniref:UPAR/Ly6 domain-containing protein n=1 Tax=Mytilus galloprovincialis TaxID=29158 RepID=A0A8B6EEC3_MYTGA|nr:Hypothetical predicted protein [Mytilus galloprovincialis]
MYILSAIGFSICLVSINIIMQGAEAGTCSECKKTYEDQGKTCSAADVYVACAEKDCTSLFQIFKVAPAKAAQLACGAGSILVNLTVIVLGLTLYTLF